MASDLEQLDLNCLGAEAMFTSYDEVNKSNDIDKEGLYNSTDASSSNEIIISYYRKQYGPY